MAVCSLVRWLLLLRSLLLLRADVGEAQGGLEAAPHARKHPGEGDWPDGVSFAGVFTNHAVLQRAPERAALYGVVVDSAARLHGGSQGDHLRVTLSIVPESAGAQQQPVRLDAQFVEVVNASYARWKALLDPHSAGGSYRVTVGCEGCSSSQERELRNITFGEVWFCSGQSNMELGVHNSFSRNRTYDAVRQGKYRHIRMFTMHNRALPDSAWPSVDPFIAPTGNEWTLPDVGTYPCDDGRPLEPCLTNPATDAWVNNTVMSFSATCWYFAEVLSDLAEAKGEEPVPIGLVHSSVGGTTVEQWQPNASLNAQVCRNATGGQYTPKQGAAPAGALWNGMVLPFVNMTIKGVLWYQGENNIHQCAGDKTRNRGSEPGELTACGNATAGTGYGCFLKQLITAWRAAWSGGPLSEGATSPKLPFGIVALAAGTSEGNEANMGAFRLAQTGGTGVLPSEAWPNTFVAHAYDLGEPGGRPGPTCAANWMDGAGAYSTSRGVAPFTSFFMGAIHPRVKRPVGQRLAHAARALVYNDSASAFTGPVARTCLISRSGTLTIGFDGSLLPGDAVAVRQAALSGTLPLDVLAEHSPQAVLDLLAKASDGMLYHSPLEVQYDGTTFADGIWLSAKLHTQCASGGYTNSKHGVKGNLPCGIDASTGQLSPKFHSANAILPLGTVNVSRITGLRYAFRDEPCCPNINRDAVPCPPGSCPIQGYNSTLPAVPFIAKVEGGQCTWISTQGGGTAASFEKVSIVSSASAAQAVAAGDASNSPSQLMV